MTLCAPRLATLASAPRLRVVRARNREAAGDLVVCERGRLHVSREAAGEYVPACARPRGVRVAAARVKCGEDASPTRLDPRSFSHLGSPGFARGLRVADCPAGTLRR